MPTDFRDGTTFPRPGREKLADVMWLARVSDKGRAFLAETIHDYIYPCPIDRGVMEHWGITREQFESALTANADDASLLTWLTKTVPADRIAAANAWLVAEKSANMDRQDAEEGVVA